MEVYKTALTMALLAVCATAFADNTGSIKRSKGQAASVTAIYVEPKSSLHGEEIPRLLPAPLERRLVCWV